MFYLSFISLKIERDLQSSMPLACAQPGLERERMKDIGLTKFPCITSSDFCFLLIRQLFLYSV